MSNSKMGERFFTDTDHTDVVFVVGKEEIPGHRNAFAIACSYFDKLLYGDFKESKSDRVKITGTSTKVFKEVKRFIYLGQLETKDWNIEDLFGLLAVAHKYQYQELFVEVTQTLEKQSLDLSSWSLVNSAAAMYDSPSLKAKCVLFAEAQVDSFLRLENMEKMTEEFICFMFDTPKISAVNQDQLLSGILQWKKTHSSAEIKSVLEKICFKKVSHDSLAIVAKLLIVNLKSDDEIFNQLRDEIQIQPQYVAKVENVLLSKSQAVNFSIENQDCFLRCINASSYLQLSFRKNNSDFEIPVERIEFELSNQYQIPNVCGWLRLYSFGSFAVDIQMDCKIVLASNNWNKYSVTLAEARSVYQINIFLGKDADVSDFILRRLVIY